MYMLVSRQQIGGQGLFLKYCEIIYTEGIREIAGSLKAEVRAKI